MRRPGPVLLVVLLAAALVPAAASARPARAQKVRNCGTIEFAKTRTRIFVLRGTNCAEARTVAEGYDRFVLIGGWMCGLTHGYEYFRGYRWGFTCGKGRRTGNLRTFPQAFIGVLDKKKPSGGGGSNAPGGPSGSTYTGSAPPPAGGTGCQTKVEVVGREVWSPCLKRAGRGYRSATWVRVGGLDYNPAKGTRLTLTDAGDLTGRGRITVRTSGAGLPAGQIRLRDGTLDTDLAHQRTFSLNGEKPITVGGLPASRAAGLGVSWTKTGANVTLSLEVGREVLSLIDPNRPIDKGGKGPTLSNGFGLEAKLATSNERGLVLDEVSATVKKATAFRLLALQDVSISYKPQERIWTGGATVIPFRSGPLSAAGLGTWSGQVELSISPIALRKVAITVKSLNKPLGATGIFLQKLGGTFQLTPALQLGGSIGVSFGPSIDVPLIGHDITAVEADGSVSLTLGPWVARGSGSVAVVKQTLADGSFTLDFSNGSGSVQGNLDVSLAGNGFEGHLAGWVAAQRGFQIEGRARVKVLGQGIGGGDAIVSSAGMGGCAHIGGRVVPDFGWRLRWGDTLPKVILSSCDIGPLEVSAGAARAAATDDFVVGKGTAGLAVHVHAVSGPAAVTVIDPAGNATPLPATVGTLGRSRIAAIRDTASGDVWVLLGRPRAGRWRVTPLPGGAPVATIDVARARPGAGVRAHVSKPRRGRRTLTWRARRIAGQRLVFVERGPHGFSRVLVSTRHARGHVRFRRADVERGRRGVWVQVVQDGAPRSGGRVARFTEHGQGPSRPRRVTVRRRGARVTIGWAKARGVATYRVTLALRDGRRLSTTLPARRRRLVLRGVARRTRGRVLVRGVSRGAVPGPARGARLR